MSQYALPDLPYEYDALEPHISARIMELHHDQHHRAYVDGANKAIGMLQEAQEKGDFAQLAAIEHALAFNVSGHDEGGGNQHGFGLGRARLGARFCAPARRDQAANAKRGQQRAN